jgi:hypothetical protein
VLLVALALLHALLYVGLVPPWQTPDEPAQFQYAALVARLGRTPVVSDVDLELEQQITASLMRAHFFEYLIGHPPPAPPQTMEQAQALFFMPSQVGNDPPLYFWLAALPIKLLSQHSIETQLLAVRLFGVVLLAGAVLCAYGAARELALGAGFALAVGLLVALQPMNMFIGMGAANDGLANLIGAALCWALLRIARQGMRLRRAALVLVLVLLSVLTKRTLLPQVLLVGLIGAGWALRQIARAPIGTVARLGIAAVLLAMVLGGRVAFAGDRAPTLAADWIDMANGDGARRVPEAPGTGRPALELAPEQLVVQPLPAVTAEWAQNQELYVDARIWSASGKVRGTLVIDFGWSTVEQPFSVNQGGKVVRMHTFIPLYCPYMFVGVRAQTGQLYVDRLNAESGRLRGLNLLTNPNLTDAAIRAGSPTAVLRRFLRLHEMAWVWRSGRLLEAPPLGGWLLGRIFFVSFWGQFGWMSLPLVGGSPWEGALWLMCIGGLAGTLAWLLRPWREPWRRRAVVLLLLMIIAGVLLPLLNAYTAPRNQAIQQGRYLFPALTPVALLLALGWRTLLPPRLRAPGLVLGLLFALGFAGAALYMIAGFYGARP